MPGAPSGRGQVGGKGHIPRNKDAAFLIARELLHRVEVEAAVTLFPSSCPPQKDTSTRKTLMLFPPTRTPPLIDIRYAICSYMHAYTYKRCTHLPFPSVPHSRICLSTR
jgi:hypothetical protein